MERCICVAYGVSPLEKSEMEDAYSVFDFKDLVESIAVADGVGSTKNAKGASSFCMQSLGEYFSEHPTLNLSSKWIEDLFKKIQSKWVKQKVEIGNTTLLTASIAEPFRDKIHIGYVGNGAIFHIRGNFRELKNQNNLVFPWNAINYLNPHTLENKDGKETLYKYISNNKDTEGKAMPSTIELFQDDNFGDIIILMTDGIFSNDQIAFGNNSSGVWQKVDEKLQKLFELIRDFLEGNIFSAEILQKKLQTYLEELKNNKKIDDDASIGILITSQAIKYNQNLNQKNAL